MKVVHVTAEGAGAAMRWIFVSYSHMDRDSAAKVSSHLDAVARDYGLRVWLDRNQIRAGDTWSEEIDRALAGAGLGILLVSSNFLESSFIREQELPRLRRRNRERTLPIIPILVRPCEPPAWLKALQIRPDLRLALSEIEQTGGAAGLERALADIMEEIRVLLGGRERQGAAAEVDDEQPLRGTAAVEDLGEIRAMALLSATLLADIPEADRGALVRGLVESIRRLTDCAGSRLFDAVRFLIELHLVRTENPTSAAVLRDSLVIDKDGRPVGEAAGPLRQRAERGSFGSAPVSIGARFFKQTNDRADLWKRYFDALVRDGVTPEETVSLIPISVRTGCLAPQFLVAGLLARFAEDWRPVLDAYEDSIPPKGRTAFQSLQASQWNTWLLWGPSIPVCRCVAWQGGDVAFQYGYGDENNSIPVVELDRTDGAGHLDGVAAFLGREQRGAKFVRLTGRLRWGPYFLGPPESLRPSTRDLDDDDDRRHDDLARRYGIVPAQASLHTKLMAHRQDSDSVVLQVERVDESLPETRVYYTAYLWMMFLVGGPVTQAKPQPEYGPALLGGKAYPEWVDDTAERLRRMRGVQLWQHLLPVFVHANIGDPAALAFQRRVLIENSIHLLRQVWERRRELFAPPDVDAGVDFHLVAASDYSGCGCEVRFTPEQSLVGLLRARLDAEPDGDFVARVRLPPPDEQPETRPWGLAGYFSACHLPELITDYYDHVSRLNERSRR